MLRSFIWILKDFRYGRARELLQFLIWINSELLQRLLCLISYSTLDIVSNILGFQGTYVVKIKEPPQPKNAFITSVLIDIRVNDRVLHL